MPIIASHHRTDRSPSRRSDYVPTCDWPDDCTVQWGGRGVVLSEKGNYGTAFFEAFPNGKGFFRGEGASVEDAERNCFEKYARFAVCDHIWGRGFKVESRSTEVKHGVERPKLRGKTAYTNGGAICKKCRAFASMFQPITKMGDWKKGPSIHDLTMAAEGSLRPVPGFGETRESRSYTRKAELRMRAIGIDLPPTPLEPEDVDIFSPLDAYALSCRAAVVDWFCAHRNDFSSGSAHSMEGLFSALDLRIMERLVLDELDARASDADAEMTQP